MIRFQSAVIASALALLLAAPGFGQGAGDGFGGENRPVPVIRVSGQAEVSAEPDIATFTVGAEIRDASASKAMAEVARITDRITAALKAQGVPQENIQTVQLTLHQERVPIRPPVPPEARGVPAEPNYRLVYVARHILQVEVARQRFKQIGDILDAVMKAGANDVGNISFGIRDDTQLRQRGLAQAVRVAREKANVMATAAGVKILNVLTLQEGSIPRPIPMYESSMRMAMSDAAPSPVPPSEIRRTYTVTVEYRIGP
ncbi:MAG: SIMPL domain-containing protein [Armatimonadetes bacterium]|nr:SIMPL domain-containing protein [Armatimonadota bacterium]